jgi:hypothetical protein
MPGLVSTSIAEELGRTAEAPSTEAVRLAAGIFAEAFAALLGAATRWLEASSLETPILAGAGIG